MTIMLTYGELTAAGRTDIGLLVETRFPGYEAPQSDTRIRIDGSLVALTIVRGPESRVARFQITDGIAEAVLDNLATVTA